MMVYKGNSYVLGRSSESSNLYSMEDGKFPLNPEILLSLIADRPPIASMDSLETFSVSRHLRSINAACQ